MSLRAAVSAAYVHISTYIHLFIGTTMQFSIYFYIYLYTFYFGARLQLPGRKQPPVIYSAKSFSRRNRLPVIEKKKKCKKKRKKNCANACCTLLTLLSFRFYTSCAWGQCARPGQHRTEQAGLLHIAVSSVRGSSNSSRAKTAEQREPL